IVVGQGGGVEAFTVGQLFDACDNNRTIEACVVSNPVRRTGQRASNRLNANLGLIVEFLGELIQALRNLNQRGTAARDDAFSNGCTRSVDGIFDAQLALVDFSFGSRADADDRDATGKLRQTLFEIVLIPRGIGALDFATDKRPALFDGFGGASAIDKHCVVLGHGDATCATENFQTSLIQVDTDFWVNHGGVGNHSES